MRKGGPIQARPKARSRWVVLAASALLMGEGPPDRALDTVTNTCAQHPEACVRVAGEESVRPGPPLLRGALEAASAGQVLRLLTEEHRTALEQLLVDCVNKAHADINLRRFGGNPTRAQCQQVLVAKDTCGRTVTMAQQQGIEKHALALQCTLEGLEKLMPGRFSLEQRYRYDPVTKQRHLVSREEARALLRQGCGEDLKGTLVPDVVIHSGNPLDVLAAYDFKFPCPSSNEVQWRRYPKGHLHEGVNQGDLYEEALGAEPRLVAPIWGIIRS